MGYEIGSKLSSGTKCSRGKGSIHAADQGSEKQKLIQLLASIQQYQQPILVASQV